MKSFHLFVLTIFFPTMAGADVLSESSPFLGSSNPRYDPKEFEPDAYGSPVYSPFSPADSDIGFQQILGTYKGRSPVNVEFDTSLNVTDNAPGLVAASNDSSWFSASRLSASWRPLIIYGWFADIGISEEVFRFERNDAADFENFEPYIGVVKSIPDLDDLLFYCNFSYQRISRDNLSNTAYDAQQIRLGFQKSLILTTHHQLTAGIGSALNITANQDALAHNEYTLDLAYTYWFTDDLSAVFSWTGAMWEFRQGSREDLSQSLGIELSWSPCKNARIYTNLYYSNYDSSVLSSVNDFEAFQSGLGIGINYSF